MNLLIEKIVEKLNKENLLDSELNSLFISLDAKLDLYEKIEACLYDTDLYLVYKHTDPNGKVYIGITQNHPQTRWNEGGGYEKQTRFYKAIQKYGWIHFKHEIVAAALSKDEAIALENELILKYNSYDEAYGYNTRVKLPEDDSDEQQAGSILEKKSANKKPGIEGQRFGKLTALRPTEKRIGSSVVWECLCDCGNTVFVARSSLKNGNTRSCGCMRKEKKKGITEITSSKKIDLVEISRKIVADYSVKTINGVIYYLTEDGYVKESLKPFIEKLLITDYGLHTRSHKEIFRQIEIISKLELGDLSVEERTQIMHTEIESLEMWINHNGLTVQDIMNVPTTELYSKYEEWCKIKKCKTVLGKKQFFRAISEKYNLTKKQKRDSKRYFVLRT